MTVTISDKVFCGAASFPIFARDSIYQGALTHKHCLDTLSTLFTLEAVCAPSQADAQEDDQHQDEHHNDDDEPHLLVLPPHLPPQRYSRPAHTSAT